MCSLAAMPSDYEMLVSHSPPLVTSHLADYSSCRNLCYESAARSSYRRRPSFPPSSLAVVAPSTPRPCLVIRPEDNASDSKNTTTDITNNNNYNSSSSRDLPSPTRLKKKVVFADDKGLALTQVRVMTEPSNVPPVWSLQFLAQVTKGVCVEVAPEPWEVTFAQPASDYLDFRHRLDTANVSLENVIVRESEEVVVGTVKVRNLCYHKEVVVRSSADGWLTHEDAFCSYVANAAVAGTSAVYYALYDTFSFRLTLPPRSRRIEFCVCFRCEGCEYWDNNGGNNYVLLKKSSSSTIQDVDNDTNRCCSASAVHYSSSSTSSPSSGSGKAPGKFSDLHTKLDSWSVSDNWNLMNDTPYW